MIVINDPTKVNHFTIVKDASASCTPTPSRDVVPYPMGTCVAFSAVLKSDEGQVVTDFTNYKIRVLMRHCGAVEKIWEDSDITKDAQGNIAWVWTQEETALVAPRPYTIEVEVIENGQNRVGVKKDVMQFSYNAITRY